MYDYMIIYSAHMPHLSHFIYINLYSESMRLRARELGVGALFILLGYSPNFDLRSIRLGSPHAMNGVRSHCALEAADRPMERASLK